MNLNKTFKDWVLTKYSVEELRDIVSNGCDSGCADGAIYYHETCALYDQYHDDIWDCFSDIYESFGSETSLQFMSSFLGAKNVNSDAQFKNLLVWFFIEETARSIVGED